MKSTQKNKIIPIPLIILTLTLVISGGALAAGALPEVETYPAADNNSSYDIDNIITLSANVSDNGSANIEIRGFVYDITPFSQPQGTDNITATEYTYFVSESGNWTGGEYSDNITHLDSGTRYFFRAGVKNNDNWGYGEELCLLTVSEPEGAAEVDATADELNRIADLLVNFLVFLVLASLVGLAYWHRDRLLYVLAGLALLVYGVSQFIDNIYIGLLFIILGIYSFVKAAVDRRKV